MGSRYSFSDAIRNKVDERVGMILKTFEDDSRIGGDFKRKLRAMSRRSFDDEDALEMMVYLWCEKNLSFATRDQLCRDIQQRSIVHLLDTLYCTSSSFDSIFVLLFTDAKSRNLLGLNQFTTFPISLENLQSGLLDIFKTASVCDLRYVEPKSGKREALVDYPLRSFGLCPCTRRPLYVATYMGKPEITRMLLSHGARIPIDDVCVCANVPVHPLGNVLRFVKAHMRSKDSIENQSNWQDISSLYMLLVDLPYCSDLSHQICSLLKELSGNKVFERVPSLQHFCRTKIRESIAKRRSRCHPQAFKRLELPKMLQLYVSMNQDAFP